MPEHEGAGELLKDKSKWINIKLTENGKFSVESNMIMDQMGCFGFLDQAKLTIIQHNLTQSSIVKPGIMDFVRRK